MPNWVENRVTITGSEAEILALRDLLLIDDPERPGELRVTFGKIIPQPEIMKKTVSGSYVSLALFALGEERGKKSPVQEYFDAIAEPESPFDYPWVKKLGITTRAQLLNWLEENSPEAIEDAKVSIRAIEEVGYANWKDWTMSNWGTKADASGTYILSDDPTILDLRFSTANTTPIPVLEAICRKFPGTELKSWHLDEMPNFGEATGSEPGENNLFVSELDVSSDKAILAIRKAIYDIDPEIDELGLEDDEADEPGASSPLPFLN